MTLRGLRSKSSRQAMRIAAMVLPWLGAGQVIAALDGIEQPDKELPEAADVVQPAAGPWPTAVEVVMIVAAVAVLIVFFRRRWHDLRSIPPRPIEFSPAVGIVLFVGFVILQRLGVGLAASIWGITAAAQPLTLQDHVKVLVGSYAAQSIGVIVFLMLQSSSRSVGGANQSRTIGSLKSIAVGVIALLLVWPVVTAVGAITRPIAISITGKPVDPIAHESLRLFLENPVDGWYIALAAMIVLLTPIFEEVAYRGVLQTALIKAQLGRWWAIAITSAIFASAHSTVDLHALPVLFVLSMAFGWAYERTGRLTTAIAMHALFNAMNLSLALVLH